MAEATERIAAMLAQESGPYTTMAYMDSDFQEKLASVADDPGCAKSCGSTASSSTLNETWREKICEWSYQVIDHFDFSREVVSISMHYLDRYLALKKTSKKTFQLVSMTCLYLAVKLYEPGRLSMASMIELSRGYFTVEEMQQQELDILRTLSWRMHPPTSCALYKHLVFFLPQASIRVELRHAIVELARFLTELSVIDYYFVAQRPSLIAVAALLNAMDEYAAFPVRAKHDFLRAVAKIDGMDVNSQDLCDCRDRLYRLYTQGGYNRPTERPETVSPVSVVSTYGGTTARK